MDINQIPNRIITFEDYEYRYFGGTNYLGITTLPEFQTLLFEGLKKWGTAYGSSRNANIQLTVYKTAEDLLAQHLATDAAVTTSSGMLAGKLALELLQKTTQVIFYFPNTHPALQSPLSLPLIDNGKLNSKLFDATISKIGIVADAVPVLQVTPIDWRILLEIPTDKEITFILDESHSIGILGNKGQGILNQVQLPNVHRKIAIASLGKALGLSGGVIASDFYFINELKKQQNFIGASGMNPAFLETFIRAQELYMRQRQKLHYNLSYVAANLIPNEEFIFSKEYPLLYFDNEKVLQLLLENKIIPTSFAYPTASGKLSRIVICAHHTKEDLDEMLEPLNHFSKFTS